jgi:putative flippase GtrA
VTGTGTTAQFSRFVVVGGMSSSLYATVFLLLGSVGTVDQAAANLLGNIASTLLANELHRRLTFRANERVTWVTAQLEGGGLAVIGLAATSSALAWFDTVVPTASPLLQLLLIVVVTGSIGVLRFVALRAWVFHADEAAAAVQVVGPAVVPAIPTPRGRRSVIRRAPRRSATRAASGQVAAPTPVA